MSTARAALHELRLTELHTHKAERAITQVADQELLRYAIDVLQEPRQIADSFTLHAPLEVIARIRLLRWIPRPYQSQPRIELWRTVLQYAAIGPVANVPIGEANTTDETELFELLAHAIRAQDHATADQLAITLAHTSSPQSFIQNTKAFGIRTLGAAAHAPIF